MSNQNTSIVNVVEKSVHAMVGAGRLQLPADYSPANALKSAWLLLQEVKDKNGNSALAVCTKESITNCLLDMVVQGLNPVKRQCYFIPYGKTLTLQRSYFGDQALALRVDSALEFYAAPIYAGDEVELSRVGGRMVITKHVTKFGAADGELQGAYFGVTRKGEDLGAEIMTMAQIQKSWAKSKTYNPKGGSSPHHEFPDQMALRTVCRRRLKPIINSSNDAMLMEAIQREERTSVLAVADEEAEVANTGEVIEIPQEEPEDPREVDEETGEVVEPEGQTEEEQAQDAAREAEAAEVGF